MQSAVVAFQRSGVVFQRFHVGGNPRLALGGIVDAVEIQRGDLYAAADPHRIFVGAVLAGVLHIESTAVFGIKAD